MKIVTLVSGGLDSTVMSALIKEEGIDQHPLFVNYGQINIDRELSTCLQNFKDLELPVPHIVEVPGYGSAFRSGLTDRQLDIVDDAFLPGRNMLLLLCGAAHAHQQGADAVAIGLLDEKLSIFPDQRRRFLDLARSTLTEAIGRPLQVITPLITLGKAEVLAIAKDRGIRNTYSCHAGTFPPCGQCIACKEYTGLEV